LPSDAWMVYGLQDVILLRQMQANSQAGEQYKRVEQSKLDAMLGFSELTQCRRQALLHYFGDEMPEPCGNCDNCLRPPQTWDATTAAQKALSCVHRTGQRFGATHLVDILLGKRTDRITNLGHDQLSTFGIGGELDKNGWRNLFRQLIAQGMLSVDVDGHGAFRLTEKCRDVLKGQTSLMLRKSSRSKLDKKQNKSSSGSYLDASSQALWDALRACRAELAKEQSVPAYMIFHDATLMEMLERHPVTLDQFAQISGVGERKLEAYGEAFIEVLSNAQPLTQEKTDTLEDTLQLFRIGMDVEAIASQRDLKSTTIYNHLAQLISKGEIVFEDVVPLSDEQQSEIEFAFDQFGENNHLKPVFEALDGAYSYEVLRCYKAAMTGVPA